MVKVMAIHKLTLFIITVGILSLIGFVIQQKTTFPQTSQATKEVLPQTGPGIFSTQYSKNLNALIAIINKQDPRLALNELQHRMDTDPFVFKNCHLMTHSSGRAAYKKYKDFNTALQYQNTTCSNGYLHGVIEAKFASLSNTQEAITELKSICSGYTHADRCWHGTGHGLMFFTSNDLPKALSICNTYSTSRAQRRCYEGVFMENFLADPDAGHRSDYLNPKNPFVPCPSEASRYKAVCYFYAPIYYLGLHNNDYSAAIQWCESAETGYTDSCTRGVGSLAMKYNIDKPKYVESLCMKSNPDDIPSCIDGMVSYYLTFTGSLSKTATLCSQLEPHSFKTCNSAVKRNIALFQD